MCFCLERERADSTWSTSRSSPRWRTPPARSLSSTTSSRRWVHYVKGQYPKIFVSFFVIHSLSRKTREIIVCEVAKVMLLRPRKKYSMIFSAAMFLQSSAEYLGEGGGGNAPPFLEIRIFWSLRIWLDSKLAQVLECLKKTIYGSGSIEGVWDR